MFALPRLTLAAGAAVLACATHAAEPAATLWTAEEAQQFCAALPEVNDARIVEIVGEYAVPLQDNAAAAFANIRELDYGSANALLQRALANQWGILDLLTDTTSLANGPCSLMMTETTLQQVDASWNLHGLWMINAPLDAGVLPMRFILFGAGKVAIGYPRAATIRVADYDFSGGKYAYTPLLIADISNTPALRGLTNIVVLERAGGKLSSFKGPRGSSIRAMSLDDDLIRVSYSVLGINSDKNISNLKIERR